MSDTNTEGAAFEPRPMSEVLRSDPAPTREEPAGRPEPTAAPQTTSDPGDKPAPQGERPRDDAGRFAPKGEQQGAPPAPEQNAPQMVPLSTTLEERKKRQAAEARLAEMEARLRASQPQATPQQPAQPEVPLSDLMFQDPERFVQVQRAAFEDELIQTRIAMSEYVARQAPDWTDAEAAFYAFAQQSDPQTKAQIAAELRRNPMPALWALEVGRKVLAQQRWGPVTTQYGSPEAYLEAVRQQQPAPAPASTAPAVPPPASLASVRSAGPRTSGPPPWGGPRPLSAILGTRR